MLPITVGSETLTVRLYDSRDCRGNARVGLRPGVLFPQLIKTWAEMIPNGTTKLVATMEGTAERVLRLAYVPWEILVVDAGGQELTVPDDSNESHELPLIAVYFVARRKTAPTQAAPNARNQSALLRERLEGISDVLPTTHCAGITSVILTRLSANFERIQECML